jgi:antitoxin ParD1/3/4
MEHAEKISITVSPEMLQFIRERVAAGDYGSTSEAIRDAVRLWRRQQIEDAERLDVIRARIRRSLDDTRPAMTLAEVDAMLDRAFERAEQTSLHAGG